MGCKSGRADRREYMRDLQRRERATNKRPVSAYEMNRPKKSRPTAETAGGVNWAHFSTGPYGGTKVITGHGFTRRFCEACDDVTLHHVRTGCVSSARHK